MRTAFRLTALFVALVTVVVWLFGGPNLGWTKTTVKIETIDPITEQTAVRWEKRFVPGVDFVGQGLGLGVIVFGASFLFRKKVQQPVPENV
jgi:hypothetical protein